MITSAKNSPISSSPQATLDSPPDNSLSPVVELLTGLAASAAFVRYQSKKVENDNPPKGKFVDINGVHLHYLERGEGMLTLR